MEVFDIEITKIHVEGKEIENVGVNPTLSDH